MREQDSLIRSECDQSRPAGNAGYLLTMAGLGKVALFARPEAEDDWVRLFALEVKPASLAASASDSWGVAGLGVPELSGE